LNWLSAHQRQQMIEKLFGIVFSFITADFSCADVFSLVRIKFNQQRGTNSSAQNLASLDLEATSHLDPHPTNWGGQAPSAAPMLSKLDHDSKYSKLAALLWEMISDRIEPLRVEIADAVLLIFAFRADLFHSADGSLKTLEDNYELYFLSRFSPLVQDIPQLY